MPDIGLAIGGCPDPQSLERLLSGLLEEDAADRLAEHLALCPPCCQKLRELRLDDALVNAVRGAATAEIPPNDEWVREVMRRLRTLRVVSGGTAADTMLSAGQRTDEDAWELSQLLDPPRAGNELGWFAGYRVLRVLGAGGMGLVLEAEDTQLQRRVALKVMNRALAARPDHRQRFLREARAAAALDHAHIVTVHQVGEHRGIPYLAMQLLKGESLADRLEKEGSGFGVQGSENEESGIRRQESGNPKFKIQNPKSPLPLNEILRIGRETAEALAVAHRHGLVHRDIKPANIWLEAPHGWIKLLDFGLAHVAEDVHLTQTGSILGTPAYMSPEQARGDGVGPASDLFSLGALLYRLATGVTPFSGSSTLAVLTALATTSPRPVSELNHNAPPALAELIMRMLAKQPVDRPTSAEAVAAEIRAIEQQSLKSHVQSPKSELDGADESDAPARRRPRWPLVAAAAAMFLAGIVVVIRDKDGRVLARIEAPDGGTVDIERKADGERQKAEDEKQKAEGKRQTAEDPRLQSTVYRLPAALPFVVVRGEDRKAYKRLTETIAVLRDGDAIEIEGDGPYEIPPFHLENKPLVIRGAVGHRPLLVAKKSAGATTWFHISHASLTLEGCDIHCLGYVLPFHCEDSTADFRNCRFLSESGLVHSFGPRIGIRDSLILTTDKLGAPVVFCEAACDVEFSNNIIRSWQGCLCFQCAGEPAHVRLTQNTFLVGKTAWLVYLGSAPIITAEANLFDLRESYDDRPALVRAKDADSLRAVSWQGRNNVYCGRKQPAVGVNSEPLAQGIDAWRALGAVEEIDSTEAPNLAFAWDRARLLPTAEAIEWLRGVVERTKHEEAKDLPELGPDWNLIGPGAAYLRALAARGAPVPSEDLRPEPTDDGPFVVLHEAKPTMGYLTLRDALASAANGDTIEIRTDGPAESTVIVDHDVHLRAAPGYLPVLEGEMMYRCPNELTIEGVHIKGRLKPQYQPTGLLRLANCSFTPDAGNATVEVNVSGGKVAAAEIVNCWIPGVVRLRTRDGASTAVRNSVIFRAFRVDGGSVAVEHSVIWNPGCGTIPGDAATWAQTAFGGPTLGSFTFSLTDTLVESAQGLARGPDFGPVVSRWDNRRNLYRTGMNLIDRMREEAALMKTAFADEGSHTAPPIDFDPLQWRLLAGSPGYQAGPDGKDLGADVSRVATGGRLP